MPQTQPTASLFVDPQGPGFLFQRVSLWHNHNHNHNHNHYNNYHHDAAGIRNPSCWPSAPPWSRLMGMDPSGAVSWSRSGQAPWWGKFREPSLDPGLDGPHGREGSEDLVPSRPLACTSSFGVREWEPAGGLLSGSPQPSAWSRTLPQAVAFLSQQGEGVQGAVQWSGGQAVPWTWRTGFLVWDLGAGVSNTESVTVVAILQ